MEKNPLRSGFTTGTCAAVAAKAAAVMLLTGEAPKTVEIITPAGTPARMDILYPVHRGMEASCAVRKDAGDDPDVTDGALVYATVSYIKEIPSGCYKSEEYPCLFLGAGRGIGLVTRPGLSCPVGMPAINPVPRTMIFSQVGQVFDGAGEQVPVRIIIEIPEGTELAEQTFNPKLGIKGGISVLGTSGIVSPMSEQALLDTIRLEIHQKVEEGNRRLILAPGNYGMDFLENRLHCPMDSAVKTSNFIADSIEIAMEEGVEEILFAGHLGKLIKVANGTRNTHSKYGDGRMETLARLVSDCCRQFAVPEGELTGKIRNSNTTEEALGILQEKHLAKPVLDLAAQRIKDQMEEWCSGKVKVEVVTFSTSYDILGRTKSAGYRRLEYGSIT